MLKRGYNYDAFTINKDRLKEIRRSMARRDRLRRLVIVMILLFAAAVLYFINNSTSEYVHLENEDITEESGNTHYVEFKKGYLKYSPDGIEFQKKFGVPVWNYPLSCSDPFVETSSKYALLGEKGGNRLTLYDAQGMVKEYTLNYPVVQADVSAGGYIEVILRGNNSNYVQVYDPEGNMVVDMRSSIDDNGYPVAAAISPDNVWLAVSYCVISGMEQSTLIVFYDLSRHIQNNEAEELSIEEGFNYKDIFMPRLTFVDDNIMAAIGDGMTCYYKVGAQAREFKKVTFKQDIDSIFLGDGYIGYVLENEEDPEEGRRILMLYNKKGVRKMEKALDMDYDTIRIMDKQIIGIYNEECTILNRKGVVLYQGRLDEGSIQEILPMGGWRRYKVIFDNKIADLQLQFWPTPGSSPE